ncbi:MAG: DUF1350 family protein [Cyanobacteria bacterium P01_C01_bin.72]
MAFSSASNPQMRLELKFKFMPLSFSWVAIHPQPKGVIQFIGGAFFGSFPTVFYHYFLKKLYEAGYTIIVLPFRFTFDHWSVALQLLREHYDLRLKLIEQVIDLGYNPEIYLQDANYRWVGHSLGCKYIMLLELLSAFELTDSATSIQFSSLWTAIKPNLPQSNEAEIAKVERQIEKFKGKVENIYSDWLIIKQKIAKLVGHDVNLTGLFLRNEASLLIAPDISDTDSAIPLRAVAKIIDRWGFGVKPNRHQTQILIQNSSLFSLTSIIAFGKDLIAGNLQNSTGDSDVAWLAANLRPRLQDKQLQELPHAYHLEPHGQQEDRYVVDFPGAIVVWITGLSFAPLTPFSKAARAFFNELKKPIIKTLEERKPLHDTAINLLTDVMQFKP